MANSTDKGEPVRDQILIMLISGGCAGAVSLGGLLALRLQSGRTVALKLFTVTMSTVLAMVAGALGTAQAMFLTQHDCGVVMVVCAAAAVCAAGMGVPLARSMTADSEALGNALRTLGDETPDQNTSPEPDKGGAASVPTSADTGVGLATAELEQVRRLLAGTSARLAESRERERALSRSRRELVAWVSHDLRTPLAGLRAMAEALEDGFAADPRQYHTQMRASAERLSAMVDDLSEMSRIHAGPLRLSLVSVSLTHLVGDAVLGVRPLAQSRRVELSAETITPLTVRVDAREMSRALGSLLTNAIRHTPNGGTVQVHTTEHDGRAVLTVTDTCGGTPEGDADPLPGPAGHDNCARAPELSADSIRGLTIVRGIVEAHSGEIATHGVPGGCAVEVRLPLPAGQSEHARAMAGRPGESRRIESAGLPQPTGRPASSSLRGLPGDSARPTVTALRRRRTP